MQVPEAEELSLLFAPINSHSGVTPGLEGILLVVMPTESAPRAGGREGYGLLDKQPTSE